MQNQERNLLIVRLELICKDYENMDKYIHTMLKDTGETLLEDLSPMQLLNLYDSVLCKILRG
jgi:hypothetical protein